MTIATGQQALAADVLRIMNIMFAKAGTALTISSGAITISGDEAYFKVSGEGAAADDLVTINGGTDGDVIILAYDGEAITLKDGTGNLELGDWGDLVLDTAGNVVMLRFDGSSWVLVSSSAYSSTPKLKGDLDANNKDVHDVKQVDYYGLYDNGESGVSKTIDWNNSNKQKIQVTGAACDLSYTDPPGPCSLTLWLIGDGTLRANIDADHDADCEWADNGEPDAYGSTDDEVIGILFYEFDPSLTPKYVVAGISRGAA